MSLSSRFCEGCNIECPIPKMGKCPKEEAAIKRFEAEIYKRREQARLCKEG